MKCNILQVQNWCFVTEKWLLCITSMLMEPEGRGRSTEIERRPLRVSVGAWN